MVVFRDSKKDEDLLPIIEKAKEIARLVTTTPELFSVLQTLIIACPHCIKSNILDAAFKPYEKQEAKNKEEAATLKSCLIALYDCDNKLDVPERRGILVEEIIASIKPEDLGLKSRNCNVRREVYVTDENEVRVNPQNIDVFFDDTANKQADGIECKTQMNWWVDILNKPELKKHKKVQRKLVFMNCLKDECKVCCIDFDPWLTSLEDDLSLAEENLKRHGFINIGLINGDQIFEAISS